MCRPRRNVDVEVRWEDNSKRLGTQLQSEETKSVDFVQVTVVTLNTKYNDVP